MHIRAAASAARESNTFALLLTTGNSRVNDCGIHDLFSFPLPPGRRLRHRALAAFVRFPVAVLPNYIQAFLSANLAWRRNISRISFGNFMQFIKYAKGDSKTR